MHFLLIGSLILASALPVAAEARVKNLILMIADGWGYNQIQALNYWQGVEQQSYERYETAIAVSTYSWDTLQSDRLGYNPAAAWSDFKYVLRKPTDSAAAATALACGVKTYDKAISVSPDSVRLETILERAEKAGKSTGVVTSVPFSHATSAAFAAHNVKRDDFIGIAYEMLERSGCEVIMGAGHPFYNDDNILIADNAKHDYRYIGWDLWERALKGEVGGDMDGDGDVDRWTLVQSKSEFRRLTVGDTPERALGIAQVHETLQCNRAGRPEPNDPQPPFTVPFNDGVPTLTDMTRAALNILDEDPDGLFLMVEGGAVDWANHRNQLGRMMEELSDFNSAVAAVEDWVNKRRNWDETLLIVTGDHETGYLWGPGSGEPANFEPLKYNGKYKMPQFHYYSDKHTNSLVPLFAKGAGSELLKLAANKNDPIRGAYLDNTDVGKAMFKLLESR